MSVSRTRLAGTLGLGLVAGSLLGGTTAPATAASPDLVISEVYGGGGNSGASFTHDFIELHNAGSKPLSVDGWSVQYRSAGGTTVQVTQLSGTVPAGGHYLVEEAKGSGGSTPLPDPDATGSIAMSSTAGQVFLVASTTPLTAAQAPLDDLAGDSDFVDMLGFGQAQAFETAPTAAPSNTAAIARTKPDDDDNADEFTTGAPSPTSSGRGPQEPEEPSEPTPVSVTIAEIQGTTDTSPYAGRSVTTTGVVTAAWPAGGLNGFNLQTPGAPETPDASDAVFVYTPGAAAASYPTVGDSLTVTGAVSEFNGLTEITASADAITEVAALGPVIPLTAVPGTDCALPGTGCLTGAALDAEREKHEGEAVQPTSPYTVTDAYDGSAYDGGGYSSAFYGEIGLAAESDQPLVTPTEVIDAQDSAAIAARTAYNTAHRVILDDGSSTNYASASNKGKPFPYLTAEHTVRVGAAVAFAEPLVLDYRHGWKLQPSGQVVGEPDGIAFEQDRRARPEDVGGNIALATFNVLNYFTTLGVDVEGCKPYDDRAGNPITVRSCPGDGPRGAWDSASFERQQAKIVDAINKLDADVVSLEEIENSLVVDGHKRDEAVEALTRALNVAAGSTRWKYVRSPDEVPADEDVIRTAFIYDPSTVVPVGASQIFAHPAFHNARQPFAQAFKAKRTAHADGFAVIANHFKSKGSGTPDPDGQGNANNSRVAQAEALVAFADEFAASREVEKVFLAGDFNAYSEEDPVQLIEEAGYTSLESTSDPAEETYNYDGMVGSLDHIFANEAAVSAVTGVDVWTINGHESVYYEYSRYNSNVTDLYTVDPFRSSDHNPEVVGIAVADPRKR